ncbi:nucleotide sugar dehydrogenase [Nocardia panacis]|uniref:Nucleotide sugar dehydrogenase n=1 Tax=Nocardia panacis TaxID=2340916 RepID=A0A3A4KCL4_9NOCA|nr:nucleotide sugar dehydrogenase [Nocardia panacis]RJO77998.1 nucleotide sugar dehydrogenase [Nocardia panacis]
MIDSEPNSTMEAVLVPRRVVVVGCGYVGLPTAMLAVVAGHHVTGFDLDRTRVEMLCRGESYIPDVPAALVRSGLDSGRFTASCDPVAPTEFDVAVIAVPTPVDADRPDPRLLERACATVARHVRRGSLVIVASTTYPGTTEDLLVPILEKSGLKVGRDFRVGYAPERIDPGAGSALRQWMSVPRIVAGIDSDSLDATKDFVASLVETVIPAPNIRTAELAKLIENTFRLVNVALVDELAGLAPAWGVGIGDALQLAATKPYGFMPFRPGVGAGGHCLPVDTRYLAWAAREASGTPALLVETALQINDATPTRIAQRILTILARLEHDRARVVVLGATYKRDVPDTRESAALKVVAALRRIGVEVAVVDPLLPDDPDIVPVLTAEMVASASLVAVLVAHSGIDYSLLGQAVHVFDACGVLDRAPNIECL